jgi:hypothetical protein
LSERSFRRDYQRRLSAARRRHERKARKAAAAAAAVGAFALAAPASSSAANFVVTDSGDAGPNTLRQAVIDSNANTEDDTITFDSSITGTITLTSGPLVVNSVGPTYHGLTITGPGSGTLAISGNDASNVFQVIHTGSDPGLTISGLTLTDGDGTYAGAMRTTKYATVTLDHDAVTASTASGDVATGLFDTYLAGGGIANAGHMTITNSTVSGNDSATGTSGPYQYGGGGIDNVGQLTIDASTITGNTSDQMGGGIFQGVSKYPSALNVSNSTISDNDAAYAGGGIGSLNKPAYGSSHNSVVNTTIAGNGAELGGGFAGKYLSSADHWTISHSTFTDNGAAFGGGIHLGIVTGSFELVDSTVSGNAANVGGGVNLLENAVKYQDATQFNNSTIASNHAYFDGGGIYLGNYTGGEPSAITPASLFSTIVADNTEGTSSNDLEVDDPSIESFDLSFSLVEAISNATISQTPAGSSILGVDPKLGALGNNGGPTQTQLPAVTSPVVDKGSAPGNLTTDQRGHPRTVDTGPGNASDGTDIGAVELPAAPVPPTPPAPPAPNGGGAAGTKVHGIKKKHKKRKHVLRTKKKSLKIHVTFSSGNPDVTFRCSVDGSPAAPCTSPFSPKVSSAPGKGKVHTVTITAVDSSGNVVGKPRTVRFRIIRED